MPDAQPLAADRGNLNGATLTLDFTGDFRGQPTQAAQVFHGFTINSANR